MKLSPYTQPQTQFHRLPHLKLTLPKFKHLFIYLFERERKTLFVHTSNDHMGKTKKKNKVKLKTGAQDSIWTLQVGGSDPSTWPVLSCIPRHRSSKREQKQCSLDSHECSDVSLTMTLNPHLLDSSGMKQ